MGGESVVVGVAGSGTMGSGIAQVAAAAGYRVILFDTNPLALEKSRRSIDSSLARQIEKRLLTRDVSDQILSRLTFSPDTSSFAESTIVIEAIVEDLAAKKELLLSLERVVEPSCIMATNTSSLSVTAIFSALEDPRRCLGIHFFNPANAMPLVELVRTHATTERVVQEAREIVGGWGKASVVVQDTPGFIVNRISRSFYLEALKICEEGTADFATIDWAMRACAGFKMGPFELIDMIGNDVNYAVSESIFKSFYYDPRFRPSYLQRQYVEAGLLGRKSGKGFYDYRDHAARPQPLEDRMLGEKIARRIVLMILNEASDAVLHRIATVEEIDLAMVKAASYPCGPLRWADNIGIGDVVKELEALQDEFGDDRYRPNLLLKRMSKSGDRFYPR